MAQPGNLRMTRQRRQILDALRQVNNHPTADEVYEMVRRRIPRISLGTVYRNLEILAELGEIQKLEFGGTAKRFDARQGLHYHIRCTCCDRVDDAPIGPVTHFETELAGVTEYRIIGHRLEFIGLCAACAREMISPGLQRQSRRLAPASAQRQVRPEAQTGEPRTRS